MQSLRRPAASASVSLAEATRLPLQVRPGSMDAEQVHEALSAALTDRDAARQMCQELRAMLAQSEALRKADPEKTVVLHCMLC